MALGFLVPGRLDQLTGGYLYDRHVVEGLRQQGRAVDVVELPGRYPDADTDTCQALDDLAVGADLFLCEAGYIEGRDDRFTGVHLTGLRAGEAAVTAQAGRVVLTHIAAWTDPAVPLAEARSVYSGPLELATPKAVYDTSRSESPS